jgi:hypothetical protein
VRRAGDVMKNTINDHSVEKSKNIKQNKNKINQKL